MPLTVQTTVVPRKAVPAFQPEGIQRKHDPAPILNTQILVPIFCASCILTVAWQTNNQNGQTLPTLDFPSPHHGQHASKVAHQKLKTCQQDTIWHLFQKLPIRGDLMHDKMRDKSNIALMCTSRLWTVKHVGKNLSRPDAASLEAEHMRKPCLLNVAKW